MSDLTLPVPRTAARDTTLRPDGPFRAIAHRGDPVGHRENTLPAIAAALEAGADLVEIDVKVTRDGEVVLLHDDSLLRLWDRDQEIGATPWRDLGLLACGGHRIPLLAEALALIGPSGAALLIDMDAREWAAPSLDVVRAAVAAGHVGAGQVAWCGRLDALEAIRDGDPAARIVLSWNGGTGMLPAEGTVAALAPEAFNPHWPLLTDDVLAWARDRGLATCCWTVDDGDRMRWLLDRGVDAIITNRIHELREVQRDRRT